MLSPDQIKKLERLAKVGDVGIADELNVLEGKIEALEAIVPVLREAKDGEKGEKGDKGDRGDSIKGDKGDKGDAGRDGVDGKDGINGRDGKDGRDGVDGRDGKDGFVDEATVAYLEEEVKKAKLDTDAFSRALGIVDQRTSFLINKVNNLPTSSGVTSVVAGTNVTVDNTDPKNPIVSATVEGGAAVWGTITGTLSDQTDLNSALSGKAASDHTHTGVYEPADATILKEADIGVSVAAQGHTHAGVYEPADATILKSAAIGVTIAAQNHDHTGVYAPVLGADDNYVTDAEKVILGNTSGTNTGDNATNTQYSGLAASKQDTLVSGTNIKTINGTSLLGSGDIVISGSGLTAPQVASLVSIRF